MQVRAEDDLKPLVELHTRPALQVQFTSYLHFSEIGDSKVACGSTSLASDPMNYKGP